MSLAPLRYRAGSPARRSAPTGAAPCPCAIEPERTPGHEDINRSPHLRRGTGQFGHQHHAGAAPHPETDRHEDAQHPAGLR